MSDLISVKRALVSVSDKTGLHEFAKALYQEFGVELISTGGTAKFLRQQGLPVKDVSELTGFPEMMDGRIKTLHPKVHGGLLAVRDNLEHRSAMDQHGIAAIDLVCINLYPFEQTISRPNVTFEEAIENIDIGGPAMVRSASKNHRYVMVVTAPEQYRQVLDELRQRGGASTEALRRQLAQKAFAHTAAYDTRIAAYLEEQGAGAGMPGSLNLVLAKKQELRYGENPHQLAALYVDRQPPEASVAYATQLHGKELSYINLLDADGALNTVKEFSEPAACIVKHTTPCGCAVGADPASAFARAFEGDPLAAFGGIVALNRPVDLATAEAITSIKVFLEVIVAPAYRADALELLRSRWKNVRLLEVGPIEPLAARSREYHLHRIVGGYLVQQRDLAGVDQADWKVVSSRLPTERETADLRFAWLVCKHVKSNAIAIVKDGMLLGAGAGQQDRVNAARIAVAKSGHRVREGIAASDAFFPFPDGPQLLLDAGVIAIIQPGGSVKDQDSIDAVNKAGAVMIFTGQRHFMH